MELKPYKKDIYLLVLCITKKCNMNCEYCYVFGNKEEYMTEDTMEQAIDFGFKMAKVLQVQITGGEPFLYFRGIRTILDLLKKKGEFILQVQTNGTVILPEIVRFVKRENIAVGMSCDGFMPYSGQTRKMGSCTEYPVKPVMRSLRAFTENGIKAGITCVVTSKNVSFLDHFLDVVYPLGSVYSVHFSVVRMIGTARNKSYLLPDLALYEKELKRLIGKWKQYGIWNKRTGPQVEIRFIEKLKRNMVNPVSFQKCHLITRTGCYVESNGDLYPCASLSGDPDFCLGTTKSGIDEERYTYLEAKFRDVMSRCCQCDDLPLCGGTCLARACYNNRFPFYECIECRVAKDLLMS